MTHITKDFFTSRAEQLWNRLLREATHLHPWTFSRFNLTAPKLTCSSTDNHPTLSRMLDQVTSTASFQRTCLSPCDSAESIHTFIRCNQLLTSLLIYKRELNIKLLLKPCVFHKIFLQVPEVKACVMVSEGCLIRMTMGFFCLANPCPSLWVSY